jgi:hypothetical protein
MIMRVICDQNEDVNDVIMSHLFLVVNSLLGDFRFGKAVRHGII